MNKYPTSIRLSDLAQKQLAELAQKIGMTQSQLIALAIDRLWRDEIQKKGQKP
jgi:predicted transcriptional regulator